MRKLIIALYAFAAVTLIFSCANRGSGPQGGPKDVTPPQVVRYSPADGSTRMTRSRIEITFDEIVVLQNPSQKVVVSPPQKIPADIKAISHKIIIELADSLLDSTTYSVDFTDAIADNNEGNKLDGFTYCFSTGNSLDSLEIAGRVLNAENLNPTIGIIVGVHPITNDTIDTLFVTKPFSRISKTNERGEFVIRNLPLGRYSVFALADIGGNFLKDMPGEEIAFLDTTFIPTRIVNTISDTIHNFTDSLISDTIIRRTEIITSPDNLLLKSFTELDTRRYLDKVQRPDRHRLVTLFNGSDSVVPTIRPINFPDSLFSHVVTFNEKCDTITFWLRDTSLWHLDTLSCLLSYQRRDFDSSYVKCDTVNYIYRYNKTAKNSSKKSSMNRTGKKKKSDESKKIPKLASSNASQKFEIYTPLLINFAMPTFLRSHDSVSYHLLCLEDSVWREIPNVVLLPDSAEITYSLNYEWKPATSYKIILDSSLFVNMIGQSNGMETFEFTIKPLEEYSKLILHLFQVKGNEVVQLLDAKDNVVRQIQLASLTDSTSIAKDKYDVTFEYVTPGTYYMRIFSDDNNDGLWTPGLYSERRQPEEVIYFPYDIELRAFWDVEEDWTPSTTRLSKPRELIPAPDKK